MNAFIKAIIFVLVLSCALPLAACNIPSDNVTTDGGTVPPATALTDEMLETTMALATTEAPITEAATTEATTTEPTPTTEAATTEAATTEAATTEATTTEPTPTTEATTAAPATTPAPVTTVKPKEKTSRPTNVITQSINDNKRDDAIMINCTVEDYAEVYICDSEGNILVKEQSFGPNFFGVYHLAHGTTKTVYIYAKAEDKTLSDYTAYTLKHDAAVGGGMFVGKDSRLYLNFYDSFYYGQQQASEEQMRNVKGYLENKLAGVRAQTGKDTKIIMVICTNPATIMHDRQYSEAEGGRGDYFLSTPTTQFADYMAGNKDIYVVDLRDILSEHKDENLFMQCDSHWSTIGAYYGYYEMMKYIKKDYPSLPVLSLSGNCKINYGYGNGGGDLFAPGVTGINGKGMRSWGGAVQIVKPVSLPSSAPTAYVMGDSYYGCISMYLSSAFSKVYLNNPASNPPLYDYSLNDLSTKKPDYLLYIWTERNIDASLGLMIN